MEKPLTRAKIVWYNFGAKSLLKSNAIKNRLSAVFLFAQFLKQFFLCLHGIGHTPVCALKIPLGQAARASALGVHLKPQSAEAGNGNGFDLGHGGLLARPRYRYGSRPGGLISIPADGSIIRQFVCVSTYFVIVIFYGSPALIVKYNHVTLDTGRYTVI
jgi:hypothetical protein